MRMQSRGLLPQLFLLQCFQGTIVQNSVRFYFIEWSNSDQLNHWGKFAAKQLIHSLCSCKHVFAHSPIHSDQVTHHHSPHRSIVHVRDTSSSIHFDQVTRHCSPHHVSDSYSSTTSANSLHARVGMKSNCSIFMHALRLFFTRLFTQLLTTAIPLRRISEHS